MSEIPRYLVSRCAMTAWRDNGMLTDQIGMVTYADHVAAIAAATEEAVRDYAEAHYANGVKRYGDGQRDERERIRAAVEALPHDPNCRSYRGGPCSCAWRVTFIAVIDGSSDE